MRRGGGGHQVFADRVFLEHLEVPARVDDDRLRVLAEEIDLPARYERRGHGSGRQGVPSIAPCRSCIDARRQAIVVGEEHEAVREHGLAASGVVLPPYFHFTLVAVVSPSPPALTANRGPFIPSTA